MLKEQKKKDRVITRMLMPSKQPSYYTDEKNGEWKWWVVFGVKIGEISGDLDDLGDFIGQKKMSL